MSLKAVAELMTRLGLSYEKDAQNGPLDQTRNSRPADPPDTSDQVQRSIGLIEGVEDR